MDLNDFLGVQILKLRSPFQRLLSLPSDNESQVTCLSVYVLFEGRYDSFETAYFVLKCFVYCGRMFERGLLQI